MRGKGRKEEINILWFRNGLRLHDNESLKISAGDPCKLLPIYIFDGKTPTRNDCKYNKMAFMLECIEDLETQFFFSGGKINLVGKGDFSDFSDFAKSKVFSTF